MKYCNRCGAPNDDQMSFCTKCGNPFNTRSLQAQQGYAESAQRAPIYSQPAYSGTTPGKKSGKRIIAVFVTMFVLAAAAIIVFVWKPWSEPTLPDVSYSYLTQKKEVAVNYEATDVIYPNLYSTMDSVVNLTATSEGGNSNILVKTEVVGFTQPFEQKVKLTEQITKLYIKPVVLTGDLDLWSSKDARLVISVTDTDTGEVIVQDTKTVKLMSVYDFILWEDEFGAYNMDNALAWLTPESEGILSLRRAAIDWMTGYTQGKFASLAGYQLSSLWGEEVKENNVVMQVVGLQGAMSDMGVRYNMGSYSMTKGINQRVLLPDEVLKSGSGVCIETALVMASALQSANMHAMLVFPPGHAQVAVETWKDSGEYFLIETTLLPFSATDEEIDKLVRYFDAEQWAAYLKDPWGNNSGSCYVVDCNMAAPLGITGLSN